MEKTGFFRQSGKRSVQTDGIKRKLVSVFRWVFLIAFGYILIYPLLFMISSAVKSSVDFQDASVVWVAKHFSTENFGLAIQALELKKTLINTLLCSVLSAFIEICSCAVAAYGLARFDFREKKFLYAIMIFTILVPQQMTVIPNVLNFKRLDFLGILGLIGKALGRELRPDILDTPLTFYLPSLFAVGLRAGIMIFIYLQFFKGLPKELEEASWIDGAGPWRTFLKVIIPSSGVVILTVSIFSVIWHWNDYYTATMYTTDNRPIAASLANIYSALAVMGFSNYDHQATAIVMAASLMFIAPMLLMYIIMQRKFVQSIDRVGIVG